HTVANGAATDGHTVANGAATDGHTVANGAATDGHTVCNGMSTDGHTVANALATDGHTVANGRMEPSVLATPQVDPAAEAELTYVINPAPLGSHTLEVVATDLSGRSTTLSQPFVGTNDSAPVIGGPDNATIDPDKGDLLKQIQDLYPVTDDLDKGLKVSADVTKLRLDKAVKLTLTVKDASGNTTTREVMVTLQRPETRLDGVCGWMNARFAKGDTITITCVKKADGTTIVTVKGSGIVVIGRIYLPGFSKLLSEPYKPVAAAKEGMSNGIMSLAPVSDVVTPAADNEIRVENGVLSFPGSSDASYEVASAAVDQPERPAPPSVDPGTPIENGTAPTTGRAPAAANAAAAARNAAKIATTGVSTSATGAALAGLLLLVAGAVAIRKGRRQES
ncbi:MAG: hypothetical protein ACRCWS_02425, partial [Propionibacteriaceae bacterium]